MPSDTSATVTATDDELPVPTDSTRTYIHVRPTTDAVSPIIVEQHVRRLHQLGRAMKSGLFRSFRNRNVRPPTVECLLRSHTGTDLPLTYAFSIDDEEQVKSLESLLRGLFPDSYELTREVMPANHLAGLETDERPMAAVEFCGRAERRRDWQTQLTSFSEFSTETQQRVPLTGVVETMATHDCPMVYQALIQPYPNWSDRAEKRCAALHHHQDTAGEQIMEVIWPTIHDVPLSDGEETRIDEITAREKRRSFVVNARVVASGTAESDPAAAVGRLASAFADVSYTYYEIEGRVATGSVNSVFDDLCSQTLHAPSFQRLTTWLPWTTNRSRGIVADATEVASFFVVSGDALTATGKRALTPTPGERTALPRPPFDELEAYRGEGFVLGHPLTQDGTTDPNPIVLPPALQPLHLALFGKSGSGKTTSLVGGVLANNVATDGASIVIAPKGDGMPIDLMRAHYATHGTLENVIHFDCARVLPAFGFFDICDELAAGVSRTTAVEDRVDHYIEILTAIMGRDRFEQAVRSPDIIRYMVKAMFDPVNGYDAFSHRDLHNAVRTMHERQAAPAVADEDLERMLAGVVANRARSFDEIMQGVANRMEKIPIDRRLARIFNHVPEEGEPHFDLADYLDEDVLIIFDTGGLRTESQRVLTLLILSNLWTALRRRAKRTDGTPSLVNLYIEEAASIAVSDLLKELLAQSRGFGCSVTLAMQFPAQLRAYGEDVYDEVLNNISSFVTGNVPADGRLAERLATDDMPPQDVANRLRALRRGQWLVSLPAAFGKSEPRPFLVESASPPPGDEDGPRPLTATEAQAFKDEFTRVEDRTLEEVGLTLTAPGAVTDADDEEEADHEPSRARVDSPLPYTRRLPSTVEYEEASHALRCRRCNNRYDPTFEGMRRTTACCSALDEVDRDDIPVCTLNLKLTPEEREISTWSDRQLMFLQAVYNAQQLRYDRLEYDIRYDSMIRLQEYVGIDADAVQDLIDAGVLSHDTDYPHRLYSVTPEGRDVIGESYRQGLDYGHGQGDLEESSEHVFAIEVARAYLEQEYVDDPDSAVTEVVPYYYLDENRRLDLAGIDADGEFVIALEVERVNHDVRRAVPEDYDKMAACNPDEAIWVVMTQSAGHTVLQALNDPLDGPVRVEKTYAQTTPPQQFRIDTSGLTAVYPVEWLRDNFVDA